MWPTTTKTIITEGKKPREEFGMERKVNGNKNGNAVENDELFKSDRRMSERE